MIKEKLYNVYDIAHCDYDFEKCQEKDILLKMLDNFAPKPVKNFNSKGTCWNFWGEFDDYFELNINGGSLRTSTCCSSFIEDFLHFLLHLAYSDDKKLICSFEWEGQITAFLTVPMGDNDIRVAVFDYNTVYEYNPDYKFESDIVIKKDMFLRQVSAIFKKAVDDTVNKKQKQNTWTNKINYILGELNNYFENPKKYKENYEPKRHIRVLDVAYKTLDNKWQFEIFLENERESDIIHWEIEKNEGKILDFDFSEQYSEPLFDWNKEHSCLTKLTKKEIKENLKPDLNAREDRNWVYCSKNQNWYSENEIMPHLIEDESCLIYNHLSYKLEFDIASYDNEDDLLKTFISDSYDLDGKLKKDELGYLRCVLILNQENYFKFAQIEFDYRNYEKIRKGLEIAESGKYVRFDLDGKNQKKLHIWQQLYYNSKSTDARDLTIGCFSYSNDNHESKELYSFTVDKKEFITCFRKALDEIEHKINVLKHTLDIGKKLKIDSKFNIDKRKTLSTKFEYMEAFKGDYACVYKDSLDGWGIINKKLEWVVKPQNLTIWGEEHPKWGREIKGWITIYTYLHNIDGKLFIAAKQDKKQYVMDINGNIKIPHVRDKIYYTYLNNELFFLAVDTDETYIVNSDGKTILKLNFEIGEKFWLFEDIIIVSKDEKFGIVDWNGKVKIDFIFSEINPDKDNLDFIPVRYINMWGFINKHGKVLNMKIKEKITSSTGMDTV